MPADPITPWWRAAVVLRVATYAFAVAMTGLLRQAVRAARARLGGHRRPGTPIAAVRLASVEAALGPDLPDGWMAD